MQRAGLREGRASSQNLPNAASPPPSRDAHGAIVVAESFSFVLPEDGVSAHQITPAASTPAPMPVTMVEALASERPSSSPFASHSFASSQESSRFFIAA